MFPFFETIATTNNQFKNLELHQSRLDLTFKEYYPKQKAHKLNEILSSFIEASNIQRKIRISYNSQHYRIETKAYTQQKHTHFFLYEVSNLIYNNKFHDRYLFNYLKNIHGLNSEVIFLKSGLISDTSYSNLCLFNGSQWFIPDHYLLSGTQRRFCLDNQIAVSKPIHYSALSFFTEFKLINALNDFNNTHSYPTSLIHPRIYTL